MTEHEIFIVCSKRFCSGAKIRTNFVYNNTTLSQRQEQRIVEDLPQYYSLCMPTHIPVLLAETLRLLAPEKGDRVLDVTLGLGGHSEELLKLIGDTGSLIAIDADEENIADAKKRLRTFEKSLTIIHANFGELPDCLPKERRQFDVILADLGLSSPHIDDPTRGFTFRADVPLDMRFDRSKGMTAAMLLASLDPDRLIRIFRDYSDIPNPRRLVTTVIARRQEDPVRRSTDLVAVAMEVYGYKAPQYLPQIFQALRIAVNREKDVLDRLLAAIPSLLAPGGRCVIISYHSLEDGPVKSAFRSLTTHEKNPMTGAVSRESEFSLLTKKPIGSGDDEIAKNPRSRSARLRAIAKRPLYTDVRSPSC